MKSYGMSYQPPIRGGMTDTRSTGAPAQNAPKPRLNDRRSTR